MDRRGWQQQPREVNEKPPDEKQNEALARSSNWKKLSDSAIMPLLELHSSITTVLTHQANKMRESQHPISSTRKSVVFAAGIAHNLPNDPQMSHH